MKSKYAMPILVADDLARLVSAMLGEEKGRAWWEISNPQLGDVTPKDMWFLGPGPRHKLAQFILIQVEEALYSNQQRKLHGVES